MICPRRASKIVVSLSLGSTLFVQFCGGADWSAKGGDAQRSSWVKTDVKISPASMAAPGFDLVWKVKLGNEPLSAPVLIDRYIGYRGFRTYAFVGGHAEDAFALDTDLGKLEWQKRLSPNVATDSGNCPGGMTAALTRPLTASLASAAAGRFGGGGRGGPAKSGVGEPMEGAVTLAQVVNMRPPTPPPAAPTTAAQPSRATPAYNPFAPRPTLLYSLSGDGTLHTMYVSNGKEAAPAIPFLPANANVSDFVVVDSIAYASTSGHCGGVADGVWAVDLETKAVTKWVGTIAGSVPAFAPSAAFVAADNKLLALDVNTLGAVAAYDAGQPFTTAPMVFEHKTKAMVAAATKDGALHIVDAASPASALAKSAPGDAWPYALATWETTAETRWILVTAAKSITAWKIVEQEGSPTLKKGWTIDDVSSPSAPLIVNGVLFALNRGDQSHGAVLAAYDVATGKKLWNSGAAVSSFVDKSGGLAVGGSSVYFGTHDGTLWDFGFPIEH